MTQFQLNLAPGKKIWSVKELTERIRDLLAGAFTDVWVEGEVSNCHVSQPGHIYFTLKDAHAQIRCVTFRNQAQRLKFRPEDGLKVTVRGSIGVYEPRGEYQLYAEHIEPVGLGALQLAFEQLKKQLEKEGLFDAARKRALPALPRRVGIVTSPRGAAVRDVVRILRRRFPNLHLLIYPTRVQGEGAAAEIVAGIKHFNRKQSVDVILLVRGGGSLEDLWAFNEEVLARAIAACTIPIISGVGHETDFTIADFVADLRASTPSAAAELVVRTKQEFSRHIGELRSDLAERIRYRLLEQRHGLRELATHVGFRRLEELLRRNRQQTDELLARLGQALDARTERLRRRLTVAATRIVSFDLKQRIAAWRQRAAQRSDGLGARIERLLALKRQRLERLFVQLEERSPLRVLERGYSICTDAAGNLLRSTEQVALGDEVRVQLSRGNLAAEVLRKQTPEK
jgi:exodeoxyribonuclease VII large subunit